MGVTIADVAKRAGVSPATVSKYLNRKRVSLGSYNRIEEAIRALDYQVNDFARGLRTNTSKMVGLLVPSVDYNSSTSLFKAIEERLTECDYGFMLYNYNNNTAMFLEKIALVRQRMVDGVIILISGETNELIRQGLRELQAANIPFVLVNGRVEGIEADTVLADYAEAIHACVARLLENGHRKIGMLIAKRNSFNAKERVAGFRKAYAERGLTIDEELLFCFENKGDWLPESKEKLTVFLQAHPEMTALVIPGYGMTIVGINAIRSVGRKIGKDMALIGYDCEKINIVLDEAITYIYLPADMVAVNAIELLINAIQHKGEKTPKLIHIPTQIIDGNSIFRI